MKPLRDLVLIEPLLPRMTRDGTRNDGSSYTLLLPTDGLRETPQGHVVAVGQDCKLVTLGQWVIYDPSSVVRVGSDDVAKIGYALTGNPGFDPDARVLVRECDIIAVVGGETE